MARKLGDRNNLKKEKKENRKIWFIYGGNRASKKRGKERYA